MFRVVTWIDAQVRRPSYHLNVGVERNEANWRDCEDAKVSRQFHVNFVHKRAIHAPIVTTR